MRKYVEYDIMQSIKERTKTVKAAELYTHTHTHTNKVLLSFFVRIENIISKINLIKTTNVQFAHGGVL